MEYDNTREAVGININMNIRVPIDLATLVHACKVVKRTSTHILLIQGRHLDLFIQIHTSEVTDLVISWRWESLGQIKMVTIGLQAHCPR